MNLQACIFDLDGVIVDTAKYHYLAWKEIAGELGFHFSPEHNERLKGVSRMASLEILLEVGGMKLTESEKRDLAEMKNDRYRQFINVIEPGEILPGVFRFLVDLKNNHIKVALGSASQNAPTILHRLNITELFDVIVDGNLISEAKPNPEVFLKGAHRMNVLPENCIVFEDAYSGIEAAVRGGMLPIGVGSSELLPNASIVIPGFRGMTYDTLNSLLKKSEVVIND